ncbi:alkaline phosphatase [Pedobacter gandavensis]|uniref:alkaline phosphatase n=1 Tax=Pedobacter gandavensis TaxID=2679963 RepID=UPI00247AC166|nr:alkaline phosphatase [Pedobacter gandavensis]WGQ09555.1 alkaline phosphatase [Pedobacter gandavensis]
MDIKNIIRSAVFAAALFAMDAKAQHSLSFNSGHSHNDYHQNIPLLTAYYAGMGAIEADVFLKNGILYVAHDASEITPEATLKTLYLEPLARFYRKNGNQPYADAKMKLQLVVDIKEDYPSVLTQLIKDLAAYPGVFNDQINPNAIRIVISGDMPKPADFQNYPAYLSFDGRPNVNYTADQLKRIAMISDDLKNYTSWNGKGNPTPADLLKMKTLIDAAHAQNKPFRFWATQDSPNTWIVLERLGADWINTDQPGKLKDFYLHKDKLTYTNPVAYPVYTPEYKVDGLNKPVKNVILLIGDGMGLAQIHAGFIANHGKLNMSNVANVGFSQTAAADAGNTDSAAGASAMAIGEKTNNRYIGVSPDGKKMTNLVDTLADYGIKSGIISVGDLTDATPAAFYAHQLDRAMSQEIAADLQNSKAEILLGSNQKSFLKNKDTELISKLKAQGFQLSTTAGDFLKQTQGKQLVVLPDSATRPVKDGRGDLLSVSLQHTLKLLSANKPGFFIMAEGAQIDYGGHVNDLPYVVTELHDFDKAVAAALQFADQNKETLVLITADHETGGLTLLDASAEKGMITGSFSTNDHTNIMVPVFAYGPGSADFKGTYPNHELFHKILKVMELKSKKKLK